VRNKWRAQGVSEEATNPVRRSTRSARAVRGAGPSPAPNQPTPRSTVSARPTLLATGLALFGTFLLGACAREGVTEPLVCELEARLQPGEMLASAAPSNEPGCGLLLPSGLPGTRYRVAILRPDSAAPSSTSSVTLSVEGLGVAPADVVPLPVPNTAQSGLAATDAPAATSFLPVSDVRDATGRFHEALRGSEEDMVREIGSDALLPTRAGSGLLLSPALAFGPSPARREFDPGTSCAAARSPRTAFLLGENAVMAIYQDSTEMPQAQIRADLIQRMLSFYEVHGRETVETYFGTLSDVDGNGRIIVVLTAQPFTEPNVVAYVWAGNFYARSSCPASDGAEIVYLNPARVRSMATGEYTALGVLSHEAQHLVSLYHRLARTRRLGSSAFLSHPTWIEEGRAEIADEVTSRRAWSTVFSGPAVNAVIGWDQLRTRGFESSRCCRPEAWGVAIEAARTIWYLSSQPNALVLKPAGAIAEADIRNGGWHFHRWLGDAYGRAHTAPRADAPLFRALTDSLTASGAPGLMQVLGKSFPQLLDEFVATLMLHGTGVQTPVPGFSTYDFVSLTASLFTGSSQPPGRYPWPVTTTGSGAAAIPARGLESASYSGSIGPTGIRIHDFISNGTGVGARLNVSSTVPMRIVVVRLQ